MPAETHSHLCIVGAGAVGLGLAARLSAVTPVSVLCRSNKAEQLRLSDPDPRRSYVSSVHSLPFEVHSLWLCVKAYDTVEALRSVEQLLAPERPVVLLANGLGIFMEAAEFVSRRAPVVRAMVNTGFVETLDSVLQSGELKFSLAGPPESEAALQRVEAILSQAGAAVHREKDIATAEWKKALVNAAVNPICSLLAGRNRMLADDPGLRALAQEVFAEMRSIAAAESVDLAQPDDEELFAGIAQVGENYNSNLMDLGRGRRTEIDYILGRALRVAADNNIPAPTCRVLYTLAKALERSKAAAAPEEFRQFLKSVDA